MRRRGQASIIGSILFFVLFAAAMAGVAYYSSSQSQASGASNRALNLMSQKSGEQLIYGALSSGALTIQNTGSSAATVVEVVIKYSNGTVYTASPSTSSLAANNLLQVSTLFPSALQSRYNAILSSTSPADQIGLVTSRGNTFWLKPAVAATTNPNLSYGITFSASGASVFGTSPVVTVDGVSYTNSQLPVTLSWFAGTKHAYAIQSLPQGAGTRVGATATGLTTATSGTLTATSAGTIQATFTTQYLLTTTGGSGVSTNPASPTSDGYYNTGTSVQATAPNAWSTVPGQSRSNLLSYSLDGSSPTGVTRSGSGNFVYSITMGAPHTLTLNSAVQYFLTTTGGNGVVVSGSQTSDAWFDSGTAATASSNWVWGSVAGQSRTAITNLQLDTVNQNPTRANTGTLTTSSITMNTYHTVAFSSAVQYFLTLGGGSSTGAFGSQTSDSWFDSGTNGQAQSAYTWSTVTGQSRSNLLSWTLDAGAPTSTSRAGSGTYTTASVAMSTYHTVTFTPVTQYYLTVSGGSNLVYINSQTSDGWYDTDTTIASVRTDTLWNMVAGQSRQNLISYTVDTGTPTSVTRANSGTYSTSSITMSTYHTVTFNGQPQYNVNAVGGNSITCASTPFNDCWGDSGSTATATTNYVWSVVAGQSRLNLVSWNLDGGANSAATRAGSGTFTTTSVTMNTFHTINFNSVTQYYVTTASSVPASGSVSALSTSYSYTSVVTQPWTQGASCSAGALIGTYYCTSPEPSSQAATAVSWTVAVTVSGTPGDSASIYTLNFNGPCSSPYVTVTSSGTYSNSYNCNMGSGAQIYWGWILSYGCLNNNYDPPRRAACGTSFSFGTASGTWTYSGSSSGSTSTTTNSYSVSGTTATYTYGNVGYSFPGGATSTSWSTTWPSAESFSSTACGSASGNTVSGSSSCTGNLVTTRTGTVPITLGASPTTEGWYDSGVSVTLSTSPTGPFSFSSWSSSSVNLVVASTSSASTTVSVSTFGTVTANFNVNQ